MSVHVAVIGAGVMGANHVRVLNTIPEAEITAVVDGDAERAKAIAGAVGARVFRSVDELLAERGHGVELDAAIVATPTATHFDVARDLISAGLATLVEKPIARTSAEGELLAEAAQKAGVMLMVGHIERFNSVTQELLRGRRRPLHIEASRVGPFSARVPESVVNDLMIHDLDLARVLAGGEVVEVSAVAQSARTDTEDMVTALLRFDNGTTASVTASRLGQQKIRQVAITHETEYVFGDLLRQDVTITRVEHTEYVSDDGARYRQTASVEIPFLENRGEPLATELRAFVDAVASGGESPVPAADGVAALKLVERVLACVR